MAGPSWLAGTCAAVMILIAAYSAGRLIFSRLRRRPTEIDADALHAVMGAAMAGMFLPQLNLLPGRAWAGMFAIAAAWFGWHAIRNRGLVTPGASRCRYPVPHLIECAAMLYMLLPAARAASAPGQPRTAMPGMGSSAGSAASLPALAVILALFMAGYVIWTTDRLATLAQAKSTVAHRDHSRHHSPSVPAAAGSLHHRTAGATARPDAPESRPEHPADRPVLAPKLCACSKIAMSIAMSYMLLGTL